MTDIKKLFVLIISVILLFTAISCVRITHKEPTTITTTTHISTENTPYVEFGTYDPNVNYMLLMIKAVVKDDMEALNNLIDKRNAKLKDAGLEGEIVDIEDFINSFEEYAGFEIDKDYMSEMIDACVKGDVERGEDAERCRNRKIDFVYPDEKKIDFNELYMLSKIITAEAGSSWLSKEWKMMVGEVLLNRVDSFEYPDTLEECIFQKGQYSCVGAGTFESIVPKEDCVIAAAELLRGVRLLNDKSVVYQAGFKQGSGVHTKLTDDILGNTYLCYSSHREKYE